MAIDTQAIETILYPTSDGQPMADNTKQFRIMTMIQGGLDAMFRERPDVFVAGDLLWYPVEGEPTIRRAPDVMVAFGRPKGDRGAYLQWREGNTPFQVVFEILSPGNTMTEMSRKFKFYTTYGVEEYYIYDPDRNELVGWQRRGESLDLIEEVNGWVSPLLGIRFELGFEELLIFRPDGQQFVDYVTLEQQRAEEQARADQEQARADQEQARADQEQARADRLAERLRTLGIDPEAA